MDLEKLARQVAIEDGNKGGIVIAIAAEADTLEIAFNGLTRSAVMEILQIIVRQVGARNHREVGHETWEPNGRVN